MKFNFEKNLTHQRVAVESTVEVFKDVAIRRDNSLYKDVVNPIISSKSDRYFANIKNIQEKNSIDIKPTLSNVIDIMMETGTGKTYTYTKTIFELNRLYGIFKFIVIVPSISIKAGTINFLKSSSSIEHFKEEYDKTINLYVVESVKKKKNKKSYMPSSISEFVRSSYNKNSIEVLIINAGMINSDTMKKSFDTTLLDRYAKPYEALRSINPFVIIDEPHKFDTKNKTWKNILELKPQFILRYGATFPEKEKKQKNILTGKNETIKVKDYQNLIYKLTAVDAFNQNLVKGVIGHITEFEEGKNVIVRFVSSDGKEATLELIDKTKKQKFKIAKKESLEKIHSAMSGLLVEHLNKSTLLLSNGLKLKVGDKINPYSFALTLQEMMIRRAVKEHFEVEKKLLTRDVKIKPLTLFFIDNIEEYRQKDGVVRKILEESIKHEIEELLKVEEEGFFKDYLQKALSDVSKTHGGYFSKDNSDKDEVIEKEINEILHDKEAILDLKNPRRFIFSKWTLREGWDNPNVFGICKLRSSGSEISKLQEVGRGLRLPVNEYGNRVKEEQFYLNYFVDFTESDFVEKLRDEINEKSGAISVEDNPDKLHEGMIKQIIEKYNFDDENALFQKLIMEEKVIDFSHKFIGDGYEYIKQNFPLIFEGVSSSKIRSSKDTKKKLQVRIEKYYELKELWEKLNEKVLLEYKFEDEEHFKSLLVAFFKKQENSFKQSGIREIKQTLEIDEKGIFVEEESSVYGQTHMIATMKYSDFLKELSKALSINLKTIHQAILESEIDINRYLNPSTINAIKHNFNNFLMQHAFNKFSIFSIEYKKVSNAIHPTKLTNKDGEPLKEVNASDIGVFYSNEKVANSYYFEELFYDSNLEKTNIQKEIKEVVVFTKIPKNSIKIPIAGGKSYSPDFAYVIKYEGGSQTMHFIVETKDVEGESVLRNEERIKIKHAEKLFGSQIDIKFKTQFKNDEMVSLIREVLSKQNKQRG